jgi:REP element-mobilizing transposase RayT
MQKFRNKYRIESTRLRNWNYALNASYFITICTAGREHFFGKIEHNEMILSRIGSIVNAEWVKTPEIRPDMNLVLDAFCVMPNHFHAIICIGENEHNKRVELGNHDDDGCDNGCDDDCDKRCDDGCDDDCDERRDAMHRVSTCPTHKPNNTSATHQPIKNKFGPQSKNLASIVRGFKSAVTVNARHINAGFAWQPRFHDHIIRNNDEFERIKKYILNNPANWKQDKFYN